MRKTKHTWLPQMEGKNVMIPLTKANCTVIPYTISLIIIQNYSTVEVVSKINSVIKICVKLFIIYVCYPKSESHFIYIIWGLLH